MRIDTLASDFELLDRWEFAIDAPPDLSRLVRILSSGALATNAIVRALVALRDLLGKWFDWDREIPRPIPGCAETSVCERLSGADRKLSCIEPGTVEWTAFGSLRHVYRFEEEALLEVSNATIHALMHLSWIDGSRPALRVYIKSRGIGSRIYMAMIWPFRHLFVYPAMLKHVASRWSNAPAAIGP